MILNPNITKAFVLSRSGTVSPPHGDMVLSVVSVRASPNFDILGVKFACKLTFKDHVCGIVSPCPSENWYFKIGETYICLHHYVSLLLFCILLLVLVLLLLLLLLTIVCSARPGESENTL